MTSGSLGVAGAVSEKLPPPAGVARLPELHLPTGATRAAFRFAGFSHYVELFLRRAGATRFGELCLDRLLPAYLFGLIAAAKCWRLGGTLPRLLSGDFDLQLGL